MLSSVNFMGCVTPNAGGNNNQTEEDEDTTPQELADYVDGQVETIDCGRGTIMTYAKDSSFNYFYNYCSKIKKTEFENVFTREYNGNLFNAYVSETEYLYAYYLKGYAEARIVRGDIVEFALEDYSFTTSEKVTPYIATVPQPKHMDGQGFIIQLSDGRFIVQDGGYTGNDRVYNALKSLKPQGKIVIAGWFISHPHGDHYPAFVDFIKDHANDSDITLERVFYNFVHEDWYAIENSTANDAGYEDARPEVRDFNSAIDQYIPNVPLIRVHTGQIINFGEAKVEILYTVEDTIPTLLENVNATSMAFKISFEGNINQTFMVLADTYHTSSDMLCSIWTTSLKSDIIQVTDVYHAGVDMVKLSLPYSVKNNKDATLLEIQNYNG